MCGGAALPSRLTGGFGKACALLERAATATPKMRKKLVGKMIGRVGGLVRMASKRAIVKQLPAGCGTALRSQLTALRTDAREARKASGR